MQLHRVYIDGPADQEVTLCPLGDIQWTSDPTDISLGALQRHIAFCLKQPHPLFVGMGDYIDFASPSNREALAQARTYDTARREIALVSDRLVHTLVGQVLGRTKGKWAGLLEGHHWFNTSTGMHCDEYLASLLKTQFLEELGVVKLKWRTGRKIHGEVTVLARHGDGGGQFPWSGLTKLYRLAPGMRVDILMMGHTTKKSTADFDALEFDAPEGGADAILSKTVKLVNTGGWMRGYRLGKRTYVSDAGMPPVALGQPIVHIRPYVAGGRWEPVITVES